MKTGNKSAFTLIELLVVIGIIGILSAVMLGLLGGTSDAARATQCISNLRDLSVAVNTFTMHDGDGNYPPAGSLKWTSWKGRSVTYPERAGWISWNTKGGVNNSSKGCPPYISFSEGDQELLRYAITNGCIWAMGGRSEKVYVCPVHDAACLKANKRHPGWSYVMNEAFKWNEDGRPFALWTSMSRGNLNVYDSTKRGDVVRPPDKVLLFAEIQGLTDAKRGLSANVNGSGNRGDCVLQYKKDNETIGFNHALSGGKLAGHVAFADGHVEKLMYPESGGAEQLTKWLCSGREVSFNGTAYQDLQGNN